MERTRALEEPISPELVLVDGDLAVRARVALPDPPWLRSAMAEARAAAKLAPAPAAEERPAPSVSERRSRPPLWRHLRATAALGLALVTLVIVLSVGLELVPGSAKPTLGTSSAQPERAKVRSAVTPRAARQTKSKPAPTGGSKRSAPPASTPKRTAKPKAHAAKPKPRGAVRVERVFSWPRYRGAVYYVVHLQRGAKTIYEVRTLKRTASIRLKLRPGRYHAVVRPAVPNDVGIILGPAIMDKIVSV